MIFYGHAGSGKTTLIRKLLHSVQGMFLTVYIFSHRDHEYDDFVHEEFGMEAIHDVLSIDHGRILVIFDGVYPRVRKFIKGRKKCDNITYWISDYDDTGIDRDVARNAAYVVFTTPQVADRWSNRLRNDQERKQVAVFADGKFYWI